jgi:hypothetical protein
MSRRRKQVTIDLDKLIKAHGECYLDMYWAKEFSAQTKCREEDALSSIRDYSDRHARGKRSHHLDYRAAADLIVGWYNSADEYSIKKLSDFVMSHDPACVWAVFLARGI